jgi:hypothetical protein
VLIICQRPVTSPSLSPPPSRGSPHHYTRAQSYRMATLKIHTHTHTESRDEFFGFLGNRPVVFFRPHRGTSLPGRTSSPRAPRAQTVARSLPSHPIWHRNAPNRRHRVRASCLYIPRRTCLRNICSWCYYAAAAKPVAAIKGDVIIKINFILLLSSLLLFLYTPLVWHYRTVYDRQRVLYDFHVSFYIKYCMYISIERTRMLYYI